MKIDDVPKSVLELLQRDAGHSEWTQPERLIRPLRSVLPFDADKLLPPVLGNRCKDIAMRMQCAPEFPAVAAICALGSVIGAGCGMRPKQKDDWIEVPNLWGGVVGRPGRLKTPAICAGFASLRALEREAEETYQHERTAHRLEELSRKFEGDALKKRLARAAPKNQAREGGMRSDTDFKRLQELHGLAPDEPRLRRYRTNDCTAEMLGDILSRNVRGLLVYRDELVGLLAAFELQGHEGDRAFYLEGWNGQHQYRVDRIGRGEIFIPHHCISVFGGIQPQKMQQYLYEAKAIGNDGFLQRFQMLVYPDDVEWKTIDESPDRKAEKALEDVMRKIAHLDFVAAGALSDSPAAIPYLRFEARSAQTLFNEWHASLVKEAAAEDNPMMQEHLVKYGKLVPALALIFHLVEHAQTQRKHIRPVSKKCVQLAIAWAKYLASHARRIYGMGCDLEMLAAERLAGKLQSGDLEDGFSERDVQRHGWTNLNDAELVGLACRELCAAGWIRRQHHERGPGRPGSPTYEINPAVKALRAQATDKTDKIPALPRSRSKTRQ